MVQPETAAAPAAHFIGHHLPHERVVTQLSKITVKFELGDIRGTMCNAGGGGQQARVDVCMCTFRGGRAEGNDAGRGGLGVA